jgi:hypothetical protein
VLDWLNEVVAMLAEIFMIQLEAAARLREQTAPLSNSTFVPFTRSNQSLFKDKTACFAVTDLRGVEMSQPPK